MSNIGSDSVLKTSFSHCYQDQTNNYISGIFHSAATIDFGECVPGCVSLEQSTSVEYIDFGESFVNVFTGPQPSSTVQTPTHFFTIPVGIDPDILYIDQPMAAWEEYSYYNGDRETLRHIQKALETHNISYNTPGAPSNLYNHNNFVITHPRAVAKEYYYFGSGRVATQSCNIPINIDIRGIACTYDTGVLVLTSSTGDNYILPKFDTSSSSEISHVFPSGRDATYAARIMGDFTRDESNTGHIYRYPQYESSILSINFGGYTKRHTRKDLQATSKGLELNAWCLSIFNNESHDYSDTARKLFSTDTDLHVSKRAAPDLIKEAYIAESGPGSTIGRDPSRFAYVPQLIDSSTNPGYFYQNVNNYENNNRTMYPFILKDQEPTLTNKLNFNHVVNIQWNWNVKYNTHDVNPQLINSFDFNQDSDTRPRGLVFGDIYDDSGATALSGSSDLAIGSEGITIETYVKKEYDGTGLNTNIMSYNASDLDLDLDSVQISLDNYHQIQVEHREGMSGNTARTDIEIPPNTGYKYHLTRGLWYHIVLTVTPTNFYVIVNGVLSHEHAYTSALTSDPNNPGYITLNTTRDTSALTSAKNTQTTAVCGLEYAGTRIFRGDRYNLSSMTVGDTVFTLSENSYCYSSQYGTSTNIPAILAPYKYPEEYSDSGPSGGTEITRIDTSTGVVSAQNSAGITVDMLPLKKSGATAYYPDIAINTNISQYNTVTSARLEMDGLGEGAHINFIGRESTTSDVGITEYDIDIYDVTLDKDKNGEWVTPMFKSDDNNDLTHDPITLLEVLEHKLNTKDTAGIAYVRSLPMAEGQTLHDAGLSVDFNNMLKRTGYPILGNLSVNTASGSISAINSNIYNITQPNPIQTVKFNTHTPSLAVNDFRGQVTQSSIDSTVGVDPSDVAVVTDGTGTVQYSLSADSIATQDILSSDIKTLNVTTAGAKKGTRSQRNIKASYLGKDKTFNITRNRDKTQYGISLSGINTSITSLTGSDLTIEVF